MKFYFAGGAMEVGGSCIHLQIAGKGILMDCGISSSRRSISFRLSNRSTRVCSIAIFVI